MKVIILFLSIVFTINTYASSEKVSLKFLKKEASKSSKKYRFNKYESMISGSIAFLAGNIGYHSTESVSLKVAYSGIQTIGIVNVGQGVYDYYRPLFDRELYIAIRKKKDISSSVIKLFAQEEKAKRMQLVWRSSLLATQYFANAYLGNTEENLKDIYTFLGGVNLIVLGYSLFYKDKYEEFYYQETITSITPSLFKQEDSIATGIRFSYLF